MTPEKKLCICRIVECNHLSIAKKRCKANRCSLNNLKLECPVSNFFSQYHRLIKHTLHENYKRSSEMNFFYLGTDSPYWYRNKLMHRKTVERICI